MGIQFFGPISWWSIFIDSITIILAGFTAYKQIKFKRIEKEEQLRPDLRISKSEMIKSHPEETERYNKHCRLVFGQQNRRPRGFQESTEKAPLNDPISIDGHVEIINLHENNPQDIPYIQEAHQNRGCIYFSFPQSSEELGDTIIPAIVFNSLPLPSLTGERDGRFIWEKRHVLLTLKNWGGAILSAKILSGKIEFMDGTSKEYLGLSGTPFPHAYDHNEEIKIYLEEITYEFEYSTCDVNAATYVAEKENVDLTSIGLQSNILKYRCIQIILALEDRQHKWANYKISMEYEKGHLVPSTKLISGKDCMRFKIFSTIKRTQKATKQ